MSKSNNPFDSLFQPSNKDRGNRQQQQQPGQHGSSAGGSFRQQRSKHPTYPGVDSVSNSNNNKGFTDAFMELLGGNKSSSSAGGAGGNKSGGSSAGGAGTPREGEQIYNNPSSSSSSTSSTTSTTPAAPALPKYNGNTLLGQLINKIEAQRETVAHEELDLEQGDELTLSKKSKRKGAAASRETLIHTITMNMLMGVPNKENEDALLQRPSDVKEIVEELMGPTSIASYTAPVQEYTFQEISGTTQSLQGMLNGVKELLGQHMDEETILLSKPGAKKKDLKQAQVRKKQMKEALSAGVKGASTWEETLDRSTRARIHGPKYADPEVLQNENEETMRSLWPIPERMDRPTQRKYSKHALEVAKESDLQLELAKQMKIPAIKEFLAANAKQRGEGSLLDKVEREVDEMAEKLSPEEFNKVYHDERVLNARLKEAALKHFNGQEHLDSLKTSTNNVEAREVLRAMDPTDFSTTLQFHPARMLISLLGQNDKHMQKDLEQYLKELGSDSSKSAADAADAEKSELEAPAFEDPLAPVRDVLQKVIDMRQEVLRTLSGVKAGRRGRSPVVFYVERAEDVLTKLSKPNQEGEENIISFAPDFTSALMRLNTVADHDRTDKKIVHQKEYLTAVQTEKRRFRTNRRRLSHYRLNNTLKAFSWLKKYNKMLTK